MRVRPAALLFAVFTLALASVFAPTPAGSPVVAAANGLPSCPVGYTVYDVQCNQIAMLGPLGDISVIGDSVLLGSSNALSSPSLPTLLANAGWGPVNFLAGKGYTTGRNVGGNRATAAAYWINRWRSEGVLPSTIVVSLGNNDNAFCPPTIACMKQTIDYLLDVIGPNTQVWWPLITTVDYARQGAWNAALHIAERERPNLITWNWDDVLAGANPPFVMDAYNIHPASGVQYVRRSRLMADDITARFGPSRRIGANAAPPPAAGPASEYEPVAVQRIVTGAQIATGSTYVLDLSATAPAGASAVALTLESRDPVGPGYFTAYPCGGDRPMTSSLNFVAGQRRAAQVLATMSTSGTVCIFSYDAAGMDVDLQGWFVPDGASRFTPVVPSRLLDTRETGREAISVIPVPAGATAVALSMVGLDATSAGSLTAWSCDPPKPDLAQIHFGPDELIAGAAYVLASPSGTVCVSTSVSADVVVDITGTFSPGGQLRYTPAVVRRMLDTREGIGGWQGQLDTGQTVDLRPAPQGAQAVSGTITLVQPRISGWLRATPCGQSQLSSSVNAPLGAILANSLTVGLSADQRLCIQTYRNGHALFDISGWWAP